MKSGRGIIFCITAILVFMIAVIFVMDVNLHDGELSFYVRSGDNIETIKCLEGGDGKQYIYVPTYADIHDISSNMSNDGNAELDVEFIQLGDVPTMYIDTRSGSMEYIHRQKKNEESGSIRLYKENGELDYSGELKTIKGRGNATWEAAKKPYSITLSQDGDLLNMGSAQNWILLANAYDHSSLKNKMIYDFARKLGMKYVPDCKWVDLFLNGEYAGLYLLCERNEVHAERVDISDAGFLVSGELEYRLSEENKPYIRTEKGMALRIHSSGLSLTDVEAVWNRVENAILSDNGIDPASGAKWDELIDVDSWVKRLLLDEVFLNFDGGLVSQFFYYDQNEGMIYAGPVWDMDNCLTKGNGRAGYPNSIVALRKHFLSEDDAPLYFALYRKPAFYQRVTDIYENLVLPAACDLMDIEIAEYEKIIRKSALANRIRWGLPDWNASINEVVSFFEERLEFLNAYWINKDDFYMVHVVKAASQWGCYAVRPGEHIPVSYVEYEDGWYDFETEESFDFKQPINEDMTVYHRDSYREMLELFGDGSQNTSELLQDMNFKADEEPESMVSTQRIAPMVLVFILLIVLWVVNVVQIKRSGSNYE